MNYLVSAFIALFLLISQSNAATIISQADYNGHTYYLISEEKWEDANDAAIELYGVLAIVEDDAENTWIYNTFGDSGNRTMWTGLSDHANEEDFKYMDWTGISVYQPSYRNFEPYYNNNNGQDYTAIGNSGLWDVFSGLRGNYGIVEVGYAMVPEPSRAILILIGMMIIFFRRK